MIGGGEIWVKNNGTNLLIAFQANGKANITTSPNNVYTYTLYILFDNINNGQISDQEDGVSDTLAFITTGYTHVFTDWHYDANQGRYVADTLQNGTAVGNHSNPGNAGQYTWEVSLPMVTNDPQDFNLPVNGALGFDIIYKEAHFQNAAQVSSGWSSWEIGYPTGLPTGPTSSANGWAQIIRQDTPPPISDTTPPVIGTPVNKPVSPSSSDSVTISVNVTDTGSGVKNVSITYTTDNWKSVNKTTSASYNLTTTAATAGIPELSSGGRVRYYIRAFDNAGNKAVNTNSGSYFDYDVTAPWYSNLVVVGGIAGALAALLVAVLLMTKRRKPSQTPAKAP